MKPYQYDMFCDKCNGTNIEWSEWEHMIWCYDCKIDTKGFDGVFGGPIPWMASKLLGLSFARLYLKDNIVRYPVIRNHKIIYTKKKPQDEVEYKLELHK